MMNEMVEILKWAAVTYLKVLSNDLLTRRDWGKPLKPQSMSSVIWPHQELYEHRSSVSITLTSPTDPILGPPLYNRTHVSGDGQSSSGSQEMAVLLTDTLAIDD
jgi:hypothetical protein